MNPIKAFHEAQNACGDEAVKAAKAEDYERVEAWRVLATKAAVLGRVAAQLMAEAVRQ